MTVPISQTAFRGPRDTFVGGALAQLRLADRLPRRVSCQCRAHWDDPALDQLRFDREVDLGTFGDVAGAMASAATSVAPGLIAVVRDPNLRLLPQFVTILDADHSLVLAGAVQAGGIRWCAPVESDAEARRVVRRWRRSRLMIAPRTSPTMGCVSTTHSTIQRSRSALWSSRAPASRTGWTRPQLLALFAANITPHGALRRVRSPTEEMGLTAPGLPEDQLLDAMIAHPVLVNRPIVCTPKGVRLCRPSERVLDLLAQMPPGPFAKEDGQLIIDAEGNRLV